jgi:hypothetical protein
LNQRTLQTAKCLEQDFAQKQNCEMAKANRVAQNYVAIALRLHINE